MIVTTVEYQKRIETFEPSTREVYTIESPRLSRSIVVLDKQVAENLEKFLPLFQCKTLYRNDDYDTTITLIYLPCSPRDLYPLNWIKLDGTNEIDWLYDIVAEEPGWYVLIRSELENDGSYSMFTQTLSLDDYQDQLENQLSIIAETKKKLISDEQSSSKGSI